MGKYHRSRRTSVSTRRLPGAAWEAVVIGVVFAIIGATVAVLAAVDDGNLSEQQPSAGAVVATAITSVPTVSGAPPINLPEVFGPGIATHIALLTATPQPIATKPSDPTSLAPTPDPRAEPEPTLVADLSDIQQAPGLICPRSGRRTL